MSSLDHEGNAAIDEAARWYAANRDRCERPIIPALRQRFGISGVDACRVLAEANRIGGRDGTA